MKSNSPKTKSGNKFLSVVLPLDLYERVQTEAKSVDRSKSKYVELLIRAAFHEQDVKRQLAVQQ